MVYGVGGSSGVSGSSPGDQQSAAVWNDIAQELQNFANNIPATTGDAAYNDSNMVGLQGALDALNQFLFGAFTKTGGDSGITAPLSTDFQKVCSDWVSYVGSSPCSRANFSGDLQTLANDFNTSPPPTLSSPANDMFHALAALQNNNPSLSPSLRASLSPGQPTSSQADYLNAYASILHLFANYSNSYPDNVVAGINTCLGQELSDWLIDPFTPTHLPNLVSAIDDVKINLVAMGGVS